MLLPTPPLCRQSLGTHHRLKTTDTDVGIPEAQPPSRNQMEKRCLLLGKAELGPGRIWPAQAYPAVPSEPGVRPHLLDQSTPTPISRPSPAKLSVLGILCLVFL